jgi:hypothetical protein
MGSLLICMCLTSAVVLLYSVWSSPVEVLQVDESLAETGSGLLGRHAGSELCRGQPINRHSRDSTLDEALENFNIAPSATRILEAVCSKPDITATERRSICAPVLRQAEICGRGCVVAGSTFISTRRTSLVSAHRDSPTLTRLDYCR